MKYEDLSEIDRYKVKNHISNLIQLSRIDGRFTKSEAEIVLSICQRYGFPRNELQEIIQQNSATEYLIPASTEEKVEQLFDFLTMILADGKIDPKELQLCKHIANELMFTQAQINFLIIEIIEMIGNGLTYHEAAPILIKKVNEF